MAVATFTLNFTAEATTTAQIKAWAGRIATDEALANAEAIELLAWAVEQLGEHYRLAEGASQYSNPQAAADSLSNAADFLRLAGADLAHGMHRAEMAQG